MCVHTTYNARYMHVQELSHVFCARLCMQAHTTTIQAAVAAEDMYACMHTYMRSHEHSAACMSRCLAASLSQSIHFPLSLPLPHSLPHSLYVCVCISRSLHVCLRCVYLNAHTMLSFFIQSPFGILCSRACSFTCSTASSHFTTSASISVSVCTSPHSPSPPSPLTFPSLTPCTTPCHHGGTQQCRQEADHHPELTLGLMQHHPQAA